jgi:hypothetical protein
MPSFYFSNDGPPQHALSRLAVFGRLDESNKAKWIVCLLDKAFRKK